MGRSYVKFELQGLKELMNKLEKTKEKGPQLVALVEAAAYDTNDDAISNIQSNGSVDLGGGGGLLSHQSVVELNGHSWEVVNSSKHAPFVEWGTGKQTKVASEETEVAAEYKGPYPGTWDEFEQNIQAWMKRHGIPEQKVVTDADGTESYINVTYYIMISILEKGLPARPFLYPAFVKNRELLLKQAKELLKK